MPTPLRYDISQAIARVVPHILRGVHLDFLAGQTITYTQFLVLVGIYSQGRSTMNKLAKNMHVSMPTATGVVDRLVRAGYAKRVKGEEKDRRCVVVELTAKGEALIHRFQMVVSKRWAEILEAFDEESLVMFKNVLGKLHARLGLDSK